MPSSSRESEDPLPPPPEDFGSRPLPIVRTRGPWHRLHRREFDPVYFGKNQRNRFDDPQRRYGVLYASEDQYGAFVEVFGRNPERRLVSTAEIGAYLLCQIKSSRELSLIDLTGGGLQKVGVTNAITTYPHEQVRPWSRAIHEHPQKPDGIIYRLKHDPGRLGLAIFERASAERNLIVTPMGSLLDLTNIRTLDDICEEYGKDII